MSTRLPKIPFKAGDDFVLTITVTNKNSVAALSAAQAIADAQVLYDAEAAKPTPNQALLTQYTGQITTATASYNTSIIVDISTWDITSSIRWVTRLLAELLVTKIDAVNGKFTISSPAFTTKNWKSRLYDADIQFSIAGKKTSSQTFQIDVKNDITYEDPI